MRLLRRFELASLLLFVGACSSTSVTQTGSDSTATGGNGGAAAGGTSGKATTRSSGGATTVGTLAIGGSASSGGALATSVGGAATTGGNAAGGSSSSGSASGGRTPAVGGAASGGATAAIGGNATGGTTAPITVSTAGYTATGGAATGGASAALGGSTYAATGGAAQGGATSGGTTVAIGGNATGGAATGGAAAGGAATGGAATGGAATGGAATGGAATGGAATGGAATGGAATGGAATGGAATGGAATGGAATGGAPSWCQTQALPANVAAADFQCIDFDKGMPPTSTWTQTLTKSGTMSLVTTRASSSPNSLTTYVPAAADFSTAGAATLTWSNVGSNPIASVSVAASLSPVSLGGVASPWTGEVSLMCVSFGSGQACLDYTYGSTYMAFQTEAYTGYFIEWMYTGGAAVRSQCKVTGSLSANIWTRVELKVTKTSSSNTIDVSFGGTSAGSCSGGFDADTVFTITVGPKASSTTTYGYTLYYDNVVAAVARSQ